MRIQNHNIDQLPATVTRPTYSRSALQTGIVHLGLGAFSRAHLIDYTEALLTDNPDWGIGGVSLRSGDTRDALAPQDGLYTVSVRDGAGESLKVIGALNDLQVAPENPKKLLGALSKPSVRIVSLTVTEKGYCHDPATGHLRRDHPDIVYDLEHPQQPRSAIAYLVEALSQRHTAGLAPFTVLSCDNLPNNGQTLRHLLLEFAELRSAALATELDKILVCPSTMVDRIVPSTTDADRERIAGQLGMSDAWPVVTEPFRQWVIEDNFINGRPDWQLEGAELVADVLPFEQMKLRLLNGSHSAMAYIGVALGFETVAEAVADADIARYLQDMMEQEISPTLNLPADYDLAAYRQSLLNRFANPALRHRLLQIAMDGSQKLPQRFLATIKERLEKNQSIDRLALAVAAWIRHLLAQTEQGTRYTIDDPLAEQLTTLLENNSNDARTLAGAVLGVREIFAADIAENSHLRSSVTAALDSILQQGVRQTLAALNNCDG